MSKKKKYEVIGSAVVINAQELPFLTFAVGGQSNACSRGPLPTPNVVMPANTRVYYQPTDSLVNITTNETDNWRFPKALGPATDEDSLVIYLAKRLAEIYTSNNICMVQVSQGGQQIDQWTNNGILYQDTKRDVEAALVLTENTELTGFFFHQGESDQATPLATYQAELQSFEDDLRAETWMGENTFFCVGRLCAVTDNAQNASLILREEDYKWNTGFADADTSLRIDTLHYSSEGLDDISEDYVLLHQANISIAPKLVGEWYFTSSTDLTDRIGSNDCSVVGTNIDGTAEYLTKSVDDNTSYVTPTTPIAIDCTQPFAISFGLVKDNASSSEVIGSSSSSNFLFCDGSNVRIRTSSGNQVDFSISTIPDTTVFNHYKITYDGATYLMYVRGVGTPITGVVTGTPATLTIDSFLGRYLAPASTFNIVQNSGLKYFRYFNTNLTENEIRVLS